MKTRGPPYRYGPRCPWPLYPCPLYPCPPRSVCPGTVLIKSNAANMTIIPIHFRCVLMVITFLTSPCLYPVRRHMPRHGETRMGDAKLHPS